MAENKVKQEIKKRLLLQILIFIFIEAGVVTSGYLYGQTVIMMVRNIVMTSIGMSILIFRLRQAELEGQMSVDLERVDGSRFYYWFFCGIIMAFIFPLLPVIAWPYPVIAVILALFSETSVGILSSAILIFISVSFSGADFSIYYLYFSSSVFSILLFQKIGEEFRFGIPIFLSGLSVLLSITAEMILNSPEQFTYESFIIPCINIFIITLFYLIFLKYYSVTGIHKYRDKYMSITDPEHPLMVELKMKSKEDYYNAIHTAHFCEKIANKLGCDVTLAKAGGYYHRLSAFSDYASAEEYQKILQSHEFPPKLNELLLNYNKKQKRIIDKETAIIYFSDAVVSSVMYLFQKDRDMEIDYEQVINTIFSKKVESGILEHCKLSIEELVMMKKVFKEEKLYYDFLR